MSCEEVNYAANQYQDDGASPWATLLFFDSGWQGTAQQGTAGTRTTKEPVLYQEQYHVCSRRGRGPLYADAWCLHGVRDGLESSDQKQPLLKRLLSHSYGDIKFTSSDPPCIEVPNERPTRMVERCIGANKAGS